VNAVVRRGDIQLPKVRVWQSNIAHPGCAWELIKDNAPLLHARKKGPCGAPHTFRGEKS
jgi:hypothetical protein